MPRPTLEDLIAKVWNKEQSFIVQTFYILSTSAFTYIVWFLEQRAIISLYITNWLVFKAEMCVTARYELNISIKFRLILVLKRNEHLRKIMALKWNTKLTLILRRSRTGTVWFYTSTSNKRAARPKLYIKSLTRDLKRMYSRLKLVRISINL